MYIYVLSLNPTFLFAGVRYIQHGRIRSQRLPVIPRTPEHHERRSRVSSRGPRPLAAHNNTPQLSRSDDDVTSNV